MTDIVVLLAAPQDTPIIKPMMDELNKMLENGLEFNQMASNRLYAIAWLNNTAVGFVELSTYISIAKEEILEVYSLFVKKKYRRLGVATKLLKWAEFIGKTNKFKTLSLYTGSENVKAQKLYRKFGFVEDSIQMVKEIK